MEIYHNGDDRRMLSTIGSVASSGSSKKFLCVCYDHKVRKYDLNGNLLWEYDYGNDVFETAIDKNNNIIVVGWNKHYVVKLGENKNVLWQYYFDDNMESVEVDESNNIYVGGYSKTVKKLTSDGKFVWNYSYTGRHVKLIRSNKAGLIFIGGENNVDQITTNKVFFWNKPSDYVVTGLEMGSLNSSYTSDSSGILKKLDANGKQKWYFAFKPNNNIKGMTKDKDGNLYICGAYLMQKVSSSGQLIWSYDMPSTFSCSIIAVDDEGNIYYNDYTNLIKMDKNRNKIWSKYLGAIRDIKISN